MSRIIYKPGGMDPERWRFFLKYRLKEEKQEAIQVIEGRDQSSKELSQNDSLQTGYASHVDVEEYKREIVELKTEAIEEKKKIQAMENLVRYLIQQQGDNLPPNIAAEMNSLGSGPSCVDNWDLQGLS
ncbi:hypothetical protein PIB30_088344 [Stylosanthes scabra]|uniref:Uncharacterized protein n=1 Tax=Stylosanthes scabra TaxID=79078 RepID=A0ABU6TU91_9FABA|nr:hypothetical protein [Stylosanthes scabra]